MFYSETLLSKTGPLARVWLSANIERKLSKQNVLQTNIENSVHAIVDQGQAPLALRLTGQLLLGVVRIYSRKARYLLDDCNEAILKIKMAFRPGNVDLPAHHTSAANPATLVLPDVLTELDLLAPLAEPSLLLSQPLDGMFGLGRADSSLLDFGGSSQISSSAIERGRRATTPLRLEEDIGLDLDLGTDVVTPSRERDIEAGRDAPTAMSMLEDRDETMKLYQDDDLELDLGLGQSEAPVRDSSIVPDINIPALGNDEDIIMGGLGDELGPIMPQEETEVGDVEARRRGTESPLSSVRSSVERDLEDAMRQPEEAQDEVDETVQHAQRSKRRKVLQPDVSTEMNSREIRDQQNDRSRILKPASFLPRDPVLLALMEMQRTGGFVSNILGDGRSRGWAPELRGILSLEIVREPTALKRKRDAEARAEQAARTESPAIAGPELNFGGMVDIPVPTGLDLGEETNLEMINYADDEPMLPPMEDEPAFQASRSASAYLDLELGAGADAFDETTAPLLHPAETGPVSLGTKHAVHLLRERFGPEAEQSAEERQRTSVLFQDLLPERTTSRADATKMFFEVLVLATKDAIKVDQPTDTLGAPLRLRAKRGLWGAWAEMEAGGEIAEQEDVAVAA